MARLNDLPLPVEELVDETAAAISGGFLGGSLQQIPRLTGIGQGMNVLPNGGGNETETNSPEESIQEASEEKELAKELIALIKERF
jgi:hypothetical protein